jgi:transposase
MARPPKEPLRPMSQSERVALEQVSRARAEAAGRVARAKALCAVADGYSFTDAATMAGRRSGDAVAHLVTRFNRDGLAALDDRHGGGHTPTYAGATRERILAEVRREPDRERDGTATWSLVTLQRALREADDGLPQVSTYTIWRVLHEEGISWQATRTWSETGKVERKNRRTGEVKTVTDPDTVPKKS